MAKAKKMKKNWAETPHVVLVVDESGSMSASRAETVSAVNDYLGGLKTTLPEGATVTVVKFDADINTHSMTMAMGMGAGMSTSHTKAGISITRLFNRVPLRAVRTLTLDDFTPRGQTPLYDAIGQTIIELDAVLKDEPSPVFFAVITDGQENASREHTQAGVKKMIEDRTKGGWTFNFLGVDIDAYAASSGLGFAKGDTVSLSRASYADGVRSMTAGIARKSSMAMSFAAEGATMSVYGSVNMDPSNSTWTAEEKTKVEKN